MGEKTQDARTYHGLDAHIVDDVICVTSIDDGAYVGVDDRFEVWACSAHPVTGRSELVEYEEVGLDPCRLRANLGGHCRVMKICVKIGRIWVRFRRGHVVYVPDSGERLEDVPVAVVLGRRTDGEVPRLFITLNNLHPFEYIQCQLEMERLT